MSVVEFVLLNEKSIAPSRGTPASAGFDLHASETVVIAPGKQAMVPTGISVIIADGYWGNMRMRSGAAVKKHLMINAGVIDSDYRGEVKIVLFNTSDTPVTIEAGERVAQIVVAPYYSGNASVSTAKLPNNNAHVGFGSTGSF